MEDTVKETVVTPTWTIPSISAEALLLADHLRSVPVGEVITYAELTIIVKADVQKRAKEWLRTARNLVEREDKMVFESVRNVGLKHLTDEEKAVLGRVSLLRINRTALRGIKKGRCVENIATLPSTKQVRWYTYMSVLGTFYQISKTQSIRRIENVIAQSPGEIAHRAVLTALIEGPKRTAKPRPENV